MKEPFTDLIIQLSANDISNLQFLDDQDLKGLASYCKAETTFTFHFSILTLKNAFLSIDNREKK